MKPTKSIPMAIRNAPRTRVTSSPSKRLYADHA
jgi:hypothetical protein